MKMTNEELKQEIIRLDQLIEELDTALRSIGKGPTTPEATTLEKAIKKGREYYVAERYRFAGFYSTASE